MGLGGADDRRKYMKNRHHFVVYIVLASVVVAFGRMHPFISDNGKLLDGFENVHDWSVYGSEATAENDTFFVKEGSQSIKLNCVNGTFSYLQKTINSNFSGDDVYSIWVYIPDKAEISYFGVRITSETDWSRYFKMDWSEPLENGWNHMLFCKSEFTNFGDENWDNTMVMMRVVVAPKTGQNASIYFDDFRYGIVGKPKVIINFDYGFDSQINKAYPIMAANGQRGVLFPKISAVGSSGYLTLTDLQTLQSAGWDISNDTYSHKRLTEISQEEMEEEIDKAYDWLMANGFESTAKFFAYPFSQYNDTVVAKVKQRHILARGYSLFEYHFDIVDFDDLQYKLRHVWCEAFSVADIEAKIDTTISKGGLLVLLFHGIVDENPGPYDYLTADFQEISDYLKAKQKAGFLEVITFSDYYNALLEQGQFFLDERTIDLDSDSKINQRDFVLFSDSWFGYNRNEISVMDINGDFIIDLKDFALFAKTWHTCNPDPASSNWE
jgi:peptidoglycan/xylan/chitin deacetylase (PgdA/CDA1 family)